MWAAIGCVVAAGVCSVLLSAAFSALGAYIHADTPRTLVYVCPSEATGGGPRAPGSWCGGVGDRINGMLAVYAAAKQTHRKVRGAGGNLCARMAINDQTSRGAGLGLG